MFTARFSYLGGTAFLLGFAAACAGGPSSTPASLPSSEETCEPPKLSPRPVIDCYRAFPKSSFACASPKSTGLPAPKGQISAAPYGAFFSCLWKDEARTKPDEGLSLLKNQVLSRIADRALRDAVEKAALTAYPNLLLEKCVSESGRKEPRGEDLPDIPDAIDYGRHTYLKIAPGIPPQRWPKELKDSGELSKNTEFWNAKTGKWEKRRCW